MKAVEITKPGSPDVLRLVERPTPTPLANEVLIAVEAAGVSRADTMQRKGLYPPPPGSSDIPGLEVAGTVEAVGIGVLNWKRGDRVTALVNGGGYATHAVAPHGQVLPVPQNWNAVEAATLPENYFTVWNNVFERACLAPGETLLVHGGSSGIGTTAIMLAKAFSCTAIATAGSDEKCAAALRLGADLAINYRTADFVKESRAFTRGLGVDVILDIVGAEYIERDIEALAMDGRIACIAASGGPQATFTLMKLMRCRGSIMASSLRPRTDEEKASIARSLLEHVWPLLPAKKKIVPVIDSTFPLERASAAHARLESSEHIGKIVLSAV